MAAIPYREYNCNIQAPRMKCRDLVVDNLTVSGTLTVNKLVVNELTILTNGTSMGPFSAAAGLSINGDMIQFGDAAHFGNVEVNGILNITPG